MMRESVAPVMIDHDDFGQQMETALKSPSDEAALAMLARGRTVTYRERDPPPGHVIRERPDGTKDLVRIDLTSEPRAT